MFTLVVRRNRDERGYYGSDDELAWANSIRVKRLDNGDTEITCVQHDEDEHGLVGVGPKYIISKNKDVNNNAWEHFYISDSRSKNIIWSGFGRSKSKVYSE